MAVRATALDLAVYRRIRSLAADPRPVPWVRRFSSLGELGVVWIGGGLAAAVVDDARRGRWLRATASVALAQGTSSTVKTIVGRKRPAVLDLPHLMATPTGLSFPSSHSASSAAAARAFSRLVPPVPLHAAAGAMAMSRLYLGVHYPSDVAAGLALGTIVGSLGR